MKYYLVGFNDDGVLVTEQVSATDSDKAKIEAQSLHPDLQIIAVKLLKQGGN
jgi:hypothetical protein